MRNCLERFSMWWDRKGLLAGSALPLYSKELPAKRPADEEKYLDPGKGAAWIARDIRLQEYPADTFPVADVDIGPGSLAIFLGAEPKSHGGSVWFHSPYGSREEIPAFCWDESNPWWIRTQDFYTALDSVLGDTCVLPLPDLCENLDVLASLRGTEALMMDLYDDPVWVKEKLAELDSFYETVFDNIQAFVRAPDGAGAFHAFRLLGKGRTAKVQCDAAAMISPDIFDRFVMPGLQRQCAYLDNSLFHLDGTQSIVHLDSILSIPELDAVEWTPQAGIEGGEHPRWYPMYKKILNAGKSLQILVGGLEYLPDLLKELGSEGIYLLTILEKDDFHQMLDRISPWYQPECE
jgi:5-methyltetrahydrofolate--homocysteine methyltransferase